MTNTEIVLNIIKQSPQPLTAYAILELCKKKKKVQAMTIYRALNYLMEQGVIHKSNQHKTFLLCNHNHNKGTIQQLLFVKNVEIVRNLNLNYLQIY
jgi:Fe2+/Zn2+ uptake regulation proteins